MGKFTYLVFILVVALSHSAWAKVSCLDPMNQFSNIPLNKEQVKLAQCRYLSCSLKSSEGMLDMGEAGRCSSTNELLKRKVFDGDFNKMLQWWQENKTKEKFAEVCGSIDVQDENWSEFTLGLDSCEGVGI